MAGFQSQIDALIADETKQAKAFLEEDLTKAMNDRAAQAEAQKRFGGRGWPPEPTREVMAFHINNAGLALKKAARSMEDYTVSYKVVAPKGKTPRAEVTVKPETRTAGGLSCNVRKGETLKSIAKDVYGSEEFAGAIYEGNPHLAKTPAALKLPAGFPLSCPKLEIPKRHTTLGLPLPRMAGEAAQDVHHPGWIFEFNSARATTKIIPAGPVILHITLELKGSGSAGVKGTVDVKTDFRAQKVALNKAFDGVALNYEVAIKEKNHQLAVEIVNTSWRGIEFKTSIDVVTGAVKFEGTPAKVSEKMGDFTVEGTFTLSGEIRVTVNPRYKPPGALGEKAAQEWKTLVLKSGAAKDALGDWVADNKGSLQGAVIVVGLVGALVLLPPPAKVAPGAALLGILGLAS